MDASAGSTAAALSGSSIGTSNSSAAIASAQGGGWTYQQHFGDPFGSEDLLDGDIVTAVEFDHEGDLLAVGDKAGRVWLYKRGLSDSKDSEGKSDPLYQYYFQFQSHDPEFDYLKSLEIEEKINMIKFLKRQSDSTFLLSTNDKTVKLWKIHDKKLMNVTNFNIENDSDHVSVLKIPKMTPLESVTSASCKQVFSNAHAYHINSISINSDCETFISADDLRVNMWKFGISDQSFNIVDIKPDNMEDLTEVITSASFHPAHCSLLMYSSSRGSIRLNDLRVNATADKHARLFELEEDPAETSFFSEIISSISDVQFTPNGEYILSRDYLTLKLWDIRQEMQPVEVVPIHDYLRPKLCDLYENDCIFDKFECSSTSSGCFVTGSYDDNFFVYDIQERTSHTIKALLGAQVNTRVSSRSMARPMSENELLNVDDLNFSKKSLHVSCNPQNDVLAVASVNNLYIYQRNKKNL